MEFQEFAKIGRLSREAVVTEKIDGTNAQVEIVVLPDDQVMPTDTPIIAVRSNPNDPGGQHTLLLYAGSRSRHITIGADNHGFAAWVTANADDLFALGPGRHYGEWWGSGIQRRYGLSEKRFSLFNVARWHAVGAEPYLAQGGDPRQPPKASTEAPACCHVVPVLHRGVFSTEDIGTALERLRTLGSVAAPGFMQPEGIVVFHTANGALFKKTLARDEEPKGVRP